MPIITQIAWLFLLAIPIACVSWTVTHEEIFKEPREFCVNGCKNGKNIFIRKFFYLFTCEYCFSHYITLIFLFLTHFKLLLDDYRGYIIAGFSLVWVANVYMGLFNFMRQNIKKEKTEIAEIEQKLES